MDPQLQQTILNAGQQTAPTSAFPELQKYYNINFQLPLSNAGVRALSGQAQAKADQSEFDTKQQIQSVQDQQSGQNYTKSPKKDGGFGFFDAKGNEISAYDYARATGKSAYEVLKDSDNPIDSQYMRDYENLQDFFDASMSGDKEKINAYYKENPSLKGLKPADVLSRFRKAYPTVYGAHQQGQRLGQTYIPNLSVIKNRLSSGGSFAEDFGTGG